MIRNIVFRFIFVILVNGTLSVFVFAQAQNDKEIWVSKIQTETSNGLIIKAETQKAKYVVSESIPIFLSIKNKGKDKIYFVMDKTYEISNKMGDITIFAPNPYPENQGNYDYLFQEIKSKSTFRTKIIIPKKFNNEENELRISIGLGFVFDLDGLNKETKVSQDPEDLRALLGYRLESIEIGTLKIKSSIED